MHVYDLYIFDIYIYIHSMCLLVKPETRMTDTYVDVLESWFYWENADLAQNQPFEPNRAKKQITCILSPKQIGIPNEPI